MSQSTPPQIEAALAQLRKALQSAEGAEIDPLTAPWTAIERGVIKLLGGAFSPQDESHRTLAFMISAALAERLRRDLGAFWFPNRASPQGASLGFPAGVIVFSPLGAVAEALGRGKLPLLDDVAGQLAKALEQARAANPDGHALEPEDYQRLFDPAFVQFTVLRSSAMQTLLQRTPQEERRELEDAFSRLPKQVPREAKEPMRRQLLEALGRLEDKPLGEQVAAIPQLGELLAMIHTATGGTGFAPAEFWQEILLPLLHIGAPESFPAVEEDELAAYRAGADPVLLYVEALPFQTSAADEDGALGVFPPEQLGLLDPAFEGSEGLRMVRVEAEALDAVVEVFDAAAIRAGVERFSEHLRSAAGESAPPPAVRGPGEPSLLEAALILLQDLVKLVGTVEEGQTFLAIRHATESEAAAEPLIAELRRLITGPRIIIPGM
jgi:hypothetical protein